MYIAQNCHDFCMLTPFLPNIGMASQKVKQGVQCICMATWSCLTEPKSLHVATTKQPETARHSITAWSTYSVHAAYSNG